MVSERGQTEENCRLKDEAYTTIYRDDEELGRLMKKVSLVDAAIFPRHL